MERYLVYDAGCSVCTQLAMKVEVAAGDKLRLISINDQQARAWLDQAFPEGWFRAPYLVHVDGKQIRAWTGLGAATRLAILMGPVKACQVWSEARRTGAFVPPGTKVPFAGITTRRNILKAGAAMAGAAGLVGLQQWLSPVLMEAQPACCCQLGCFSCTYYGYQCYGYCAACRDVRYNFYYW